VDINVSMIWAVDGRKILNC